ncbi:MAG: hypothetical protein MK098_11770 [Marinovum sp.]|nr:hypothetical protein [Marinovum sp.]
MLSIISDTLLRATLIEPLEPQSKKRWSAPEHWHRSPQTPRASEREENHHD